MLSRCFFIKKLLILVYFLFSFVFIYSAQAQEINEVQNGEESSILKLAKENKNTADIVLLMLPLSGHWKNFGESAKNGAELAWESFGGGLQLVVVDENSNNPQIPLMDNVAVVIGHLFNQQLARLSPIYQRLKTPVLLPFIGDPQVIEKGSENYFSLMPSGKKQGQVLGNWLLRGKRTANILILSSTSSFNSDLTESFLKTIKVEEEILESEVKTAKGKKTKGKSKSPKPIEDLLLLEQKINSVEDLNLILQRANEQKPKLIVLALDNYLLGPVAMKLFETDWGKSAQYIGGVNLGEKETAATFLSLDLKVEMALPFIADFNKSKKKDSVETFVRVYSSKYHKLPAWPSFLAYDSLEIAVKAASFSLLEGDSKAALEFLNDQNVTRQGLLGTYRLKAGGEPEAPLAVITLDQELLAYLP